MEEIWKDIKGYEGLYKISNFGNVKRLQSYVNSCLRNQTKVLRKERILKQCTNSRGYNEVILSKNNIHVHKRIHKLVAEEFIPNTSNLPYINHIDGNKKNNCVDNLEWCTQSHNIREGFRIGLYKTPKHCFKKGDFAIKINQYDLNNKLIKRWNSIGEAADEFKSLNKYPQQIISYALRLSKSKSAFGYIWRYADN
ncbi:MAG: NUMOD4 motif-containing HNH endonuclease [Lachnospiraceae bacterium]|nr:NUMOD4 motif-containing HNH endonuclease [Lachnospiraceae bacterium]